MDSNRNIYFPDIMRNGGTIWKLNSKGALTSIIENVHAHNVVLDANGHVITAHGEGNHTMLRIDDSGEIDTLFHTTDINDFFGGNCTWSSRYGIIYGLKERKTLAAIDDSGLRKDISAYEFEWNQTIYSDPEGIVYAPDIGVDNGILVRIDTLGNASVIARDLISKLDRPRDKHNDVLLGVTRGCDDHIYIAELAGKRIIKILDEGMTEDFYLSDGDWFPCAIDFFSGDAYIMEYRHSKSGMKGPRIIRIDEAMQKEILYEFDGEIKQGSFVPATDGFNEISGFSFLKVLVLCFSLLLGVYFFRRVFIA